MAKKKDSSKGTPKEEVIRKLSEVTPETKQKIAESLKRIITELDKE